MAADAPAAFFSYSREDSDFALRLATDLKAAGAVVWIDQLDIEPGTQWDNAVEDALNNCPRMLVILSPLSVKSGNVRDEISRALRKQKTIIPILYLDCDIPLRLERHQHIDFRTDHARGLKALLRALGVVQSPQPTAPAPPAAAAERRSSDVFAQTSRKLERERLAAAERARSEEESKEVKVWKLRELHTISGHPAPVYGVAVTPDGERVVSASQDTTLKVWELASGSELRPLVGHKGPWR